MTQEQYERVIGENPSHKIRQRPVDSVSWHDAIASAKSCRRWPEEQAAGRGIACLRRPSGNMRAGLAARHGIRSGTTPLT